MPQIGDGETSMSVLYYVRHGETDFNSQGRLQGRRDTVLNAHGRRQAAECGVLLHALFARERRQPQDFKYVSSPLKRVRKTMEIVRASLGLEPHDYEIDARLIEIAYGEWEGLTLPEIETRNAGISMRLISAAVGLSPASMRLMISSAIGFAASDESASRPSAGKYDKLSFFSTSSAA